MTAVTAAKIKLCIVAAVALILVSPCVIGAVAYIANGCSPADYPELDAEILAKDCVRRSLKSPSSARFIETEWKVIGPDSEGTYLCSGPVDADNVFGASIRHDCTVIVQRRGDKWRCVDIAVVPRQ